MYLTFVHTTVDDEDDELLVISANRRKRYVLSKNSRDVCARLGKKEKKEEKKTNERTTYRAGVANIWFSENSRSHTLSAMIESAVAKLYRVFKIPVQMAVPENPLNNNKKNTSPTHTRKRNESQTKDNVHNTQVSHRD